MQGKKHYTEKLFCNFQLSERVPTGNFYRNLKDQIDLQFVYKATQHHYGKEGQKSIDPVVFFKLLLVGYLENINSDRRLIEFCSMRLDVLYFLDYDIDEALPWHSTISRTRQLYGEEVFLDLFKAVLAMCISKGMVNGKRQAVDSAYIKANASLDSLCEKEILDDVKTYSEELNENSEFKIEKKEITPKDKSKTTISKQKQKDVDGHHNWKKVAYKHQPGHGKRAEENSDETSERTRKFLSNHTHHSPTDPDARISTKPGKPRQMNYYAQIAVDEASHVITGAGADFADKKDSQCLEHLLEQTIENLNEHQIELEQILADTGYSSGEALAYLESKKIDAYIPNFGLYKPNREGFIYNKEKDQYECIRGNHAILPFKKIHHDANGYTKREYRSDYSRCKDCPLKSTCLSKTNYKKIEDSIYRPYYDRMHEKLKTPYAKRIFKKRGSTVEPVLGSMLNYGNLKRVNTRGIEQANKHVLMAATVYNLKKCLRFNVKKPVAKVMAKMAEKCALKKSTLLNFMKSLLPTPNYFQFLTR